MPNTVVIPCWRFTYDEKTHQLRLSTIAESTCSESLRQVFPVVYIGCWPEHIGQRYEDERTAIDIARQINITLARIAHSIDGMDWTELEKLLSVLFAKKFGFWTTQLSHEEYMTEFGNSKPLARKPKFKRPNKHSQLSEVIRRHNAKAKGLPEESKPRRDKITKPLQEKAEAVGKQHEKRAATGNIMSLHPAYNERQVDLTLKQSGVHFGSNFGGYIESEDHKPKRKAKPLPELLKLGVTTDEKAADFCRRVYKKYGVRLQCLNIGTNGSQAIFMESKLEGKWRGVIRRMFKAIAE